MNQFHNTTNESGQLLLTFEQQAKTEQSEVYKYFRNNPNKLISSDDFVRISVTKYRIGNIKRAFSNLFAQDKIRKTDKKTIGREGRPVCLYQYNPNPKPLEAVTRRLEAARRLVESLEKELINLNNEQ